MRTVDVLRLRVAAFCLFLICGSCRQTPHDALRRLALLPADVLAPGAPDWVRAAAPIILRHDLSPCKSVFAVLADNDSDAYRSGASEAIEATVDSAGGQYSVMAGVRSLSTQRITQVSTEKRSGGIIAALDHIAKAIDPEALPFPTRNEAALGAYVSALQANDLGTRVQHLREAVRQAPEFGAAQLELIAAEAQTGAPELAETTATAQRYSSRFDKLDRARFDALVSAITHRPLTEQAAAATAVIKVAPNDTDLLTNVARDRFLLGDGAGGEQFLRRAMQLQGTTPQLQIELLRGLVETRQFSQAAQILAQQPKSVANVLEQAACWLLVGNAAKADSVAAWAITQQTSSDPLATLRRAEWTAAKGDIAGAAALAGIPDSGDADAGAAAQAQAAVWYLQLGRRSEAQRLAASSVRGATTATAKQMAEVAFLLANSANGADLRTHLAAAQARGSGRDTVLAFGLFLYGDYAAAAEAWRAVYAASGERDLQSRILLAACYARMNRNGEIAAMHVLPVLPNLTGADPFATITFGEMRRLLRL